MCGVPAQALILDMSATERVKNEKRQPKHGDRGLVAMTTKRL